MRFGCQMMVLSDGPQRIDAGNISNKLGTYFFLGEGQDQQLNHLKANWIKDKM